MENHKTTIDKLSPGESAVVENSLSGRLRDLGLTVGTRIRCLYRAPLGDPTAYEVRGAVIALRREDGCNVRAVTNG